MIGSPEAQQMFQQLSGRDVLTGAVLSAMFALLGVVASGYGVQVALHLLGPSLGLDQWLLDVSPFAHVPRRWDIG